MAKPKMYGMNKQFFFHGKDSAESYERMARMEDKKIRKEKAKWI